MENDEKPIRDYSEGVVVVRPKVETMSRQQLPYYVGYPKLQPVEKIFP